MKPLRHLWPAIESVVGLKAVQAEWRLRLADEFELLKPFLVVTSDLATTYPTPTFDEPWRVVGHDFGDFSAINPRGGEPLTLKRVDVLINRFDVVKLAGVLAKVLNASGGVTGLSGASFAWRMGTLPLELGACPAYLTIPWDSQDLRDTVETIGSQATKSYLLLTPTRQSVDARVEAILQANGGQLIAAEEIIQIDTNGRLHGIAALQDKLRALFSATGRIDQPVNVFRREGGLWNFTFGGHTAHAKNRAGFDYIRWLLSKPNQLITAGELHSARTGIDPLIATGGTGDLVTNESREKIKEQMLELQVDLDKAKANHDLARTEQVQREIEQLKIGLKSSEGLGGRSRRKTDADRITHNVTSAIRRAISAVKTDHQPLGRHLLKSIETGSSCRYLPEAEMEWLT